MVYLGKVVSKLVILCLTFLVFLGNISPPILAATSPWSQADWSSGNFSSSSNVTTSTANQVTLTKQEKLTNTGFESDLTGWNNSVTSFSNSKFNGISGSLAAWPLDDTTSTQSYARVVNPSVAAGRNMVLNGTFDSDTLWTKGTGWDVNTTTPGKAHAQASAVGQTLSQSPPIIAGKAYQVTYTISGYSSGAVRILVGGGGVGTTRSANGTYTETVVCSGTLTFYFQVQTSAFTGDIDDVTVTQVNIPASNSSPTQLLTDGDMEASGVTAWSAGNSANLSKDLTTPHGGTRSLKIERNGATPFWAFQSVLTIGRTYRVTGYFRGDGAGVATPFVSFSGGSTLASGTNSTVWQPFDVIGVATGTNINLAGNGASGYVEFDDVVVSEDNYIRSGELVQDGNMETSGISNWTAVGTPVITKQTVTQHGGNSGQVLQVAQNVNINPGASQSVLVAGKTYRATGWFRGDGSGTAAPRVNAGGSFTIDGTNSTTWQYFDFTGIPTGTNLILYAINTTVNGQYAQFDDISVTEIDPLIGRPTNGVTLGTASGGHLSSAYSFDGTNDNVNIYSSDLNGAFNPNEGTVVAWVKVSGVGVWTDSTNRFIFSTSADANNLVSLIKISTANTLQLRYWSGTGSNNITISSTAAGGITDWIQVVLTWSKAADQVKAYINGAQVGTTQTGLGTWVGNMGTTTTVIGAQATTGNYWSGLINDVRLYNSALSATDIANLYNGVTSTRDTSVKLSGTASSKVVGAVDENGTFTQNVNVGDTNQYHLSANLYIDGTTPVDSTYATLWYNGSAVSTTYTSVGSGWYKLTGTVTGVASSADTGVQVLAGKTVYVDDVSLNNYPSSGTLTSSIFDSGAASDWGTLTYAVTTPTNTAATVKVRTSNFSDLSDAAAFGSCNTISTGVTVGGTNCASNGMRYAQYQVTLTSTDLLGTSTFTSFSLPFSNTYPNFTVDLNSPGNNEYTNNTRPSFSWKKNATGGVVKYTLQIDQSGYNSIIVSDIPPDRSTDIETTKYLIHYELGSSGSIYFNTKSSSDWAASENDGKLREGTVTWKVIAYDAAGTQTTASRTLYVDTSAPTLSNVSISSGNPPTVTGSAKDVGSGVDKVEVKMEKQNIFAGWDLYLDASLGVTNNQFSFTPKVNLDSGMYKVNVIAKDKAGNTSTAQSLNLSVGEAISLPTPKPSVTPVQTPSSLKQTPIPSGTPKITPAPVTFKLTLPKISLNIDFGGIINSWFKSYVNLAIGIQKYDANISNSVISFVGSGLNLLAGLYSSAVNGLASATGKGIQSISLAFSGIYNNFVNRMIAFSGNVSAFVKNSLDAGRLLALVGTQTSNLVRNDVGLRISRGFKGLAYAFVNGVNNIVRNTKLGISNLALGVGRKVKNVSGGLGQLLVNVGYSLVGEPTTITNIKVANISPTSVKISWETNHLATGEVDYGLDETYPMQIQSKDLTQNHEFVLKNLKPGTSYSFEVMSHGKNYVYNANRKFVTLPAH